jgi:hypothetical protein
VGRGGAGVLDEVRVPRRDERAADPVALQAAQLDHPPSPELVLGILEHAAERTLVRRLRLLAPDQHLVDGFLDLPRRARYEPELDPGDDLPGAERRVSIGEVELGTRKPSRPAGVDDERPLEDRTPVAAVGSGVHPHAAACCSRDCAGELEPTETGRAGPVQADGVRRSPARDQQVTQHLGRGELAFQPDHQSVDSLVGCEDVRSQPDRPHCELFGLRPRECLLQLG